MNALTLILRGARFYWRTHLGVVLGAALATMVLTGSLLTGDAVKATLRRQALARVGNFDSAFWGGDRFFRAALAEEINSAPVIALRGSVTRVDGTSRINQTQVLGVDEAFWQFAPRPAEPLATDGFALNERAAAQLAVRVGDTLIVRVEKPGRFSRDAPLSGEENAIVSIRRKVEHIVSDKHFSRFSLQASQVPPFTVFVPRRMLDEQLTLGDQANLLLVPRRFASLESASRRDAPTTADIAGTDARLRKEWTLADMALELRKTFDGGMELRTPRVFFDPPVVVAAPRGKDDRRVDALTYFVNALEASPPITIPPSPITPPRSTPYSMVTAVETAASGFLPAELADGEIVISQWLADDLGIGVGGEVTVKYFVMGARRELVEQARKFTVRAVLPMNEPQLNTSWMPDFPGLSDKANCRDWKPGFDFDATRMRDKDQAYWEKYRGTPKAFVNLKAGQEMWGNRWGNVTSMRWPAGTERAEIERELRAKLSPEQLGFQFLPLRAQALAATDAPVDFGQLFVYFSFFLIAAAAALTGMLFTFSLEQRNAEAGLLLALGLQAKQVRRLFLAEGAVLAIAGSVLGVCGAVLYTKLVLRALATVWRGAVGTTDFVFTLKAGTLVIGVVSGVVIAVLAMWWASRRQARRTAQELLTGEAGESGWSTRPECAARRPAEELSERVISAGDTASASSAGRRRQHSGRVLHPAFALGCLLAAGALLHFGGRSAGIFFGAGALLLIAGLLLCVAALRRAAVGTDLESLAQLGVRNAARRRGRSVGIMGVLASGVFMVVAVDAFRQRPAAETARRDTGTGGFALVGESALPIYDDLNTAKGREAFALDEKIMEGVRVVPLRVRDGDDASCLNLNKALQPRVLGVKPEDLAGAFRFAGVLNESDPVSVGWGMLDGAGVEGPNDGAVAGIVDANTLQWALKSGLGKTLDYRDERGGSFKVRFVGTVSGSILQGSLVISEKHFVEKFPGNGGYRFFLIDAPREKVAAVREHLSRQLADRGLELTPAGRRLAEFQAVENTYLSIFQALGGLGLLLGSAGLAIVVARNVLERRREFGLLAAVGFRQGQLRALVFAEHRWLIVCGLAVGTASAIVAVWPGLRERAGGFPYVEMALLLGGLTLGCVFWAWVATRVALRGSGVAALRSE